jgi:hypothetical protein
MQDKGNKVAVQRALDAYNRARAGYPDRETAVIYLLEGLERDWTEIRDKEIKRGTTADLIPTFDQLARAASRMAKQ